MLSDQDLATIWHWNANVPEQINKNANDLITAQITKSPTSPAVCAFDGDFTYGQLDQHANRVANCLITAGLSQDDIVVVYAGKTKWTAVAFLAIIRAGGVILAIDTSQPPDRLQQILEKSKARIALSLSPFPGAAQNIVDEVFMIQDVATSSVYDEKSLKHNRPELRSSSPLYIVFTSGSTGTPKGVVITHSNFCSAVHHQASALGFSAQSRVFDFASSSFDVALNNVLMTLSVGGCICVPSEWDRKNDIAASIVALKANQANITPSVARLLDPETVPNLKLLSFGGEAVTATELEQWSEFTKVIAAYGPAECTVCSTTSDDRLTPDAVSNIGRGRGVNTWIVDPDDSSQLLPIGTAGELLLEGPIVGNGYFNDEAQTASAFVEDPPWLLQGTNGHEGRRGKLYKTGDLAQYTHNGELSFAGRKDTMVKIGGQRVELSDIEYHVQLHLPQVDVVAEIITPSDSERQMLIVFLGKNRANEKKPHATENGEHDKHSEASQESSFPARFDVHEMITGIGDKLKKGLPAFMIPYAYLPIDEIPMLISGKIDRKTLQRLGKSLSLKQIETYSEEGTIKYQAPSTDTEVQLRDMWAQALQVDPAAIGTDDNFFRMGGDSIVAMRLVMSARKKDIRLAVQDVLKNPRLQDMAKAATGSAAKNTLQATERFGLLPQQELDQMIRDAKQRISYSWSEVDDMTPVTAYQSMSLDDTQAPHSIDHFYFDFDDRVSTKSLKNACAKAFESFDALRTVFIPYKDSYLQIVMKRSLAPTIDEIDTSDLEQCTKSTCQEIRKGNKELGRNFTRFSIIRSGGIARLILTVSHAQYDGISLPVFLEFLETAYSGAESAESTPFVDFLHGITSSERESHEYWRRTLKKSSMTCLKAPDSQAETNNVRSVKLSRGIKFDRPIKGYTTATTVYAAWTQLLAEMTGSSDIVFGRLVAGRNTSVVAAERTFGACANQIPMRVTLQKDWTISNLLDSIQSQQADSASFENVGLPDIIQHCAPSWDKNTEFNTIVQYQNIDLHPTVELAGNQAELVHVHQDLIPTETNLKVTPNDQKLTFEIASHTGLMDKDFAQNVLEKFVDIFDRMTTASGEEPLFEEAER